MTTLTFLCVFRLLWKTFPHRSNYQMWRNTPKSGGMRWEGSARNPTSILTLPFLDQFYHFDILTSINTLTCFISSSLVQLVKKSLFVYFVWFIRAYRFGTVKKIRYVTIRPFVIWQCMGIFRLFCRCLLGHYSASFLHRSLQKLSSFAIYVLTMTSQIFSKINGYTA